MQKAVPFEPGAEDCDAYNIPSEEEDVLRGKQYATETRDVVY